MIKKILLALFIFILTACNAAQGDKFEIELFGEGEMHEVELDKGTYLIDCFIMIDENNEYYIQNNLFVNIYDEDENLIDAFAPFEIDNPYLDFLYLTFFIPEKGTYYIEYASKMQNEAKIVIKKAKYNTSFKDVKPFSSNLVGRIEGILDIDTYYYQNDEKSKIARITNNLDEEAYLIVKLGDSYQQVMTIEPKGELYFTLQRGVTNIGFTHKNGLFEYMSEDEFVCSYDVNLEILDLKVGQGLLGDMEELTTEYSNNIYTVGLGLYDSCLSLNVKEEGVYKIESDKSENISGFGIRIESETGEVFGEDEPGKYELPVGKYIVYLVGDSTQLFTGRVKYTFYSTKDRDIQIEVPEVDFNNGKYDINAVRQIKNQKIIDTQLIKYWFELKEKSHIFYDEKHVFIFDENGNPLSIPQSGQYSAIMVLEAGKYYFTTPDLGERGSIFFCKMNNFKSDYDYSLVNPILLEENQTMSFNKDWQYDQELIKIVIKEKSNVKITFTSAVVIVFDNNFNIIRPENAREKIFNLEAGEYYLEVRPEGKSTIKYEIVS